MAKKILTLDIGAANVALAEYELGAKGALKLLNYGTAALAASVDSGDAGTILSPAILQIVREKGIRPGPVAISVAGQMVFPRFASIPAAGGDEKFEQMVRYEIEQNVPFPIDEMICDRQVLGDTETGDKAVMIVAAKTEQIEAITDAVVATGFKPMLVDVAPVALTNAVRHATGDDGCVVILDIGAKTTSLVISEGNRLYNRSIPIAGNNLTREIAQALGCTQEEAESVKCERAYVSLGGVTEDADEVADRAAKVCRAVLARLQAEISRSVNFYRSQQGGGAPQHIYLTGGTALLPQIDQFFAEALQTEVTFFSPFDFVEVGPQIDADAAGSDGAFLSPTAGLALHAADIAPFAVNLLPPSILANRADQAKIPVVAAACVAILAGLSLALVAFNGETKAIEEAGSQVESVTDSLKKFKSKTEAGAKSVAASADKANELKSVLSRRVASVARFRAVSGALGPGLWVDVWEPGRLRVRGWKDALVRMVKEYSEQNGGKHLTAPEIVAERLKGMSAIDAESVKIADMTDIGKNASVQQFTVELKFK